MFAMPFKAGYVSALTATQMTSPAVAHERVHTTSYEKSSAIFRRVSKATMTQDVRTRTGQVFTLAILDVISIIGALIHSHRNSPYPAHQNGSSRHHVPVFPPPNWGANLTVLFAVIPSSHRE